MTASPEVATPVEPAVPPDWVPVERRVLGMDRRALVPALVVALLGVIAFWALPALDEAVAVDDPVRAGDVIQLESRASFAPAVGWNVESGLRQGRAGVEDYPGSAQLTSGGVVVTVVADAFRGSSRALLAQIERTNKKANRAAALTVSGEARTVTTVGGQRGVLTAFTTSSGRGLLAAFSSSGTGVAVVAASPGAFEAATQQEVVEMVESIRLLAPDDEGGSAS